MTKAPLPNRAAAFSVGGGRGVIGEPPPFAKADRSRFLQALGAALARFIRTG